MNSGLIASFTKAFPGGPVIRIDDLTVPHRAAVTVLFGASGSGKSTVLRCLAGLERPDAGCVRLGRHLWFDAEQGVSLPARERNVGFVPQDYALFPHLTLEGNVGYGLAGLAAGERGRRVAESLEWLGLRGLEKRFPDEMSGGQQQRAALARAVVRRPQLLLLDEPFAALDGPMRTRLRGELRALLLQAGVPTLLVTHDRSEALTLGDHLIVLHEGCILQQGPAHEVFSRPSTLAAAGILSVETIQPGLILARHDGLATVAVKDVRLTALPTGVPDGVNGVYVCIRAEDVILTLHEGEGHSSPRNRLAGVVRQLLPEGALVRVEVDCGFPLLALLTRQGCEQLGLHPGAAVHALLKAPQIHLIPHPG